MLAPVALRLPRPVRARPALAIAGFVSLIGTALPDAASFAALSVLPSGIVSIQPSLVPALALPMAIVLGIERLAARRVLGLAIGLAGTLLLVAPGAGGSVQLRLLPLGLVVPALYALEDTVIARHGAGGLRPVQLMAGATLIALPRALGGPEAAVLLAALIHAAVYTTFVAPVGRAGSVFSTQVGHLVTLFGVLWPMLLPGERYGPAIWAALALILAGIALMRPRPARAGARVAVAPPRAPRQAVRRH